MAIIDYCDFCPLNGKCENQERGYECAMPVKLLYIENRELKIKIEKIEKEIYKKKSYMSKIISIKEIIDKC
jgi:adenine-specific DNA glycosylase